VPFQQIRVQRSICAHSGRAQCGASLASTWEKMQHLAAQLALLVFADWQSIFGSAVRAMAVACTFGEFGAAQRGASAW
jgi:hypothetical protein